MAGSTRKTIGGVLGAGLLALVAAWLLLREQPTAPPAPSTAPSSLTPSAGETGRTGQTVTSEPTQGSTAAAKKITETTPRETGSSSSAEEPKAAGPAPGVGPASSAGVPESSPQATGAQQRPRFDIVRVDPEGSVVVAGHAVPGMRVEVMAGDEVVAETRAGADGSFVALFDLPESTGPVALSLMATGEGGVRIASARTIIVTPPEEETEAPVLAAGESAGGAGSVVGGSAQESVGSDKQEMQLAEAGAKETVPALAQPAQNESAMKAKGSAAARGSAPAAGETARKGGAALAIAQGAAPGGAKPMKERVGSSGQSVAILPADKVPTDSGEAGSAGPEALSGSLTGQNTQGEENTQGEKSAVTSSRQATTEAATSGKEAVSAVQKGVQEKAANGPVSSAATVPSASASVPSEEGSPATPAMTESTTRDGARETGPVAAAEVRETVGKKTEALAVAQSKTRERDRLAGAETEAGGEGGTEAGRETGSQTTVETVAGAATSPTPAISPSAAGKSAKARQAGEGKQISADAADKAGASRETGQEAGAEVPAAPKAPASPTVIAVGENGVEVLQASEDGEAEARIAAITYDPEGEVVIAGTAPANTHLRLNADALPIKEVLPEESGKWHTRLPELPPGTYRLELEAVDASGRVVARDATPFRKEPPEAVAAAKAAAAAKRNPPLVTVTVQPGNTLWGISRRHYGGGRFYVWIYDANADQIRDPDLIYPGQVFVIPQKRPRLREDVLNEAR